jgi:starvation-inducible outer membrane lipoprotein
MKKIIFILSLSIMLVGCSNAPVAMKSNKKYFAPVKTLAQKPVTQNNKMASASVAKELSEKETMIELLKKENQQLRDRVAKLEKRLSIIQS